MQNTTTGPGAFAAWLNSQIAGDERSIPTLAKTAGISGATLWRARQSDRQVTETVARAVARVFHADEDQIARTAGYSDALASSEQHFTSLGAWLKQRMAASRQTHTQIAAAAGIHPMTLSRLRNGVRNASDGLARRLARVFEDDEDVVAVIAGHTTQLRGGDIEEFKSFHQWLSAQVKADSRPLGTIARAMGLTRQALLYLLENPDARPTEKTIRRITTVFAADPQDVADLARRRTTVRSADAPAAGFRVWLADQVERDPRTLRALAAASGIDETVFEDALRSPDRRPSERTVRRLAVFFDGDVDELVALAGYRDARVPTPDPRDFLHIDPALRVRSWFRATLVARRESAESASAAAGLSQAEGRAILRGAIPHFQTLDALANYFGVNHGDLRALRIKETWRVKRGRAFVEEMGPERWAAFVSKGQTARIGTGGWPAVLALYGRNHFVRAGKLGAARSGLNTWEARKLTSLRFLVDRHGSRSLQRIIRTKLAAEYRRLAANARGKIREGPQPKLLKRDLDIAPEAYRLSQQGLTTWEVAEKLAPRIGISLTRKDVGEPSKLIEGGGTPTTLKYHYTNRGLRTHQLFAYLIRLGEAMAAAASGPAGTGAKGRKN